MITNSDGAVRAQPGPRGIRVVHLVTAVEFGGLEKVVLDLVSARTKNRFDTHVLCVEGLGALAPRFAELGVPVETIGRRSDSVLRRAFKLAGRLRALGTDVLHTHNPGPHLHGALAARLAGVPVLVHTKHGRNLINYWSVRLGNRFAASLSDCVVAVSDDAAQVSRDVERVPAAKVRTIHNGVDLGRFRYRGPREGRTDLRLVTVGRLNPVKDQASLLRALHSVRNQGLQASLDIVGDGPLREELEGLCGNLGLEAHVRILGFHDDVRPFLNEADVFVLPSLSEGIPVTLLEAMAVGLPCVATDVGGNREVIVPGETGYLVPAGDSLALADRLMSLHANPGTLARFGRASRTRVEEEFNLAGVVARYEALYLELLERRKLWTAPPGA